MVMVVVVVSVVVVSVVVVVVAVLMGVVSVVGTVAGVVVGTGVVGVIGHGRRLDGETENVPFRCCGRSVRFRLLIP